MPARFTLPFVAATMAASAAVGALVAVAPAASAAAARPALTVHAGTTRVVSSRSIARPGRVDIRNIGKRPIVILTAGPGEDATTLVQALNNTSISPAVAFRRFPIDGIVSGGTDAFVPLRSGTVFLIDATRSKFAVKNVTAITITGQRRDAAAPKSANLTAKRNGTITPVRGPASRDAYLHLINDSDHTEALFRVAVRPTASAAAVRRFIANPTPRRFGSLLAPRRALALVTFLSGHHAAWTHYHARAGRYLLWITRLDAPAPTPRSDFKPGTFRLFAVR